MNEVLVVAKKEFMDNWRNKWIIAVSAVFLILTLAVSYFGTRGDVGWKDIAGTVGGMMFFIQWLVPIIGLMLGYATIIGEQERGSLSLILSYPIKRFELIIGKFIGLGAVLALANLIGFGVGGIVIGANVKGVQWGDYIIFISASILLGLVFIAVSMLFSCVFKKRSATLGGAVFLWFLFAIIWSIILVGIATALYGFETLMDENWIVPTWYAITSVVNPISAFSVLVSLNVTPITLNITQLPSIYNTTFMLVILFSWIVISLFLAIYIFERKDL